MWQSIVKVASIQTNSQISKICSVCKGNRKSTNNFKWKYEQ